MKFKIYNRFTGEVQFTALIDADEDTPRSIKMGLAVRWGYKNNSNLSDSNLSGSNLSGSNLSGSDLSGSDLSGSDLSGSNLSGSDLRGSNLSDSNLRDSNLSDSDLRGSNLSDSDLRDSNLSGSNLSDSNLSDSDLRGSNLSDSDLSGSNLSGSNLSDSWIPKIKNIHQSVYDSASAKDGLEMGSWHTCDTTHCRAGWVTTLAGEGGRVLEGCYGTAAAAALIYMASDSNMRKVPDFYTTNKQSLADMKELAEKESS